MKLKLKSEKIAKQFGKKVGQIVIIPDSQVEKALALGWGVEAKEEKVKIETKELKLESETKEDATN